jgi:hypothetical protein
MEQLAEEDAAGVHHGGQLQQAGRRHHALHIVLVEVNSSCGFIGLMMTSAKLYSCFVDPDPFVFEPH